MHVPACSRIALRHVLPRCRSAPTTSPWSAGSSRQCTTMSASLGSPGPAATQAARRQSRSPPAHRLPETSSRSPKTRAGTLPLLTSSPAVHELVQWVLNSLALSASDWTCDRAAWITLSVSAKHPQHCARCLSAYIALACGQGGGFRVVSRFSLFCSAVIRQLAQDHHWPHGIVFDGSKNIYAPDLTLPTHETSYNVSLLASCQTSASWISLEFWRSSCSFNKVATQTSGCGSSGHVLVEVEVELMTHINGSTFHNRMVRGAACEI